MKNQLRGKEEKLFVMVGDLDKFKAINDPQGKGKKEK